MMSLALTQSGHRRRGLTFGAFVVAMFLLATAAPVQAVNGPPAWGPPSVDLDVVVPSDDTPTKGVAASDDGSVWTVDSTGVVTAHAGSTHFGDLDPKPVGAVIVGIAAVPDGSGYWLATDDGSVSSFGSAGDHGDVGPIELDAPVVGVAATSSGQGYWLAASDGGVFAFGDAQFHGSAAPFEPVAPVVAIAARGNDSGYWLAASDGGVFSFGDAEFYGSMGAITLDGDVVGMAALPDSTGYWLAGADGGIFSFGSAKFQGSGAGEIQGVATAVAALGDETYVLAIDTSSLLPPLPDPTESEEAQDYYDSLTDDQIAIWDAMAECESNQRWDVNTGNGFYGGLQFSAGSWRAVGGEGLAHQATRIEQIYRGALLQDAQGWGAWPGCSRRLGLL